MKKGLLLLLVLLSLTHTDLRASHVLGGGISYRCLGNGNFEFTVTIYRDCTTGSAGWSQTAVSLQGPMGGTLPLVSATDITPRCLSNTTFVCNPPSSGHGPSGSISRLIYRGNLNLSSLGAAPSSGYTWFVSFPCCRPSLNNMIGSQQALQVKMFPFTDPSTGQPLTPAQLCDQSPQFITDPVLLAINNPSDTLHLQNLTLDQQSADSTVYSIDFPISNILQPYAYNLPYSQSNPLPGILGPPTVPVANTPIHPATGEIVLRPVTNGTFVLVVLATSYRQGQRIAQVFQDVTLKVISNPAGAPPPFVPSPTNALHAFSQRPPIIYPPLDANGQPRLNFTYYVGDTIVLPIQLSDLFPMFSGNPNDPNTWQPQTNDFAVAVAGLPISASNDPSTGCNAPPCATLRGLTDPGPPALPLRAPTNVLRGNGNPLGLGYTDTVQGGFQLVWIPEADTVLLPGQVQVPRSRTYPFLISAIDRNCPLEGETRSVLNIEVVASPVMPRPVFDSISRQNGQNRLHFNMGFDAAFIDPIDVANFGTLLTAADSAALMARSLVRQQRSFQALRVYKAVNYFGPYQQVAHLQDPQLQSWLDTSQQAGNYYFIEALSGTPVSALRSLDTLIGCTAGRLNVITPAANRICVGGSATLSFDYNAPHARFQWYRNGQAVPGANSNQLAITVTGNYQAEVVDTVLQCSSISPLVPISFYPAAYDFERLCAVTVSPSLGTTDIYWEPTQRVHIATYHIYRETLVPDSFEHIGSLPFESGGLFIDTAAASMASNRRYRIVVEDVCGMRSNASTSHRAMTLDLTEQSNGAIDLSWTPYEGRPILEYDIMRSTGGAFQVIGTRPANNLSFTDVAAPAGPKVYFVRTLLANGCRPGPIAPIITALQSNAVAVGAATSASEVQQFTAKVYPNPSSGVVTIEAEVVPKLLVLRDLLGRALLSIQPEEAKTEIDLGGWPEGTYLLEVQMGVDVRIERIVLQR